jgi:hypothetical protein
MKSAPTPKGIFEKIVDLVWTLGLCSLVLFVAIGLLRSVAVFIGIGLAIAGITGGLVLLFRRHKERQW